LFVQADYALSVWPVLGNPNGQKLDRISPFIFLDKTTHFQLNFDLETYAKQHIQLNKPTYALKLAKKSVKKIKNQPKTPCFSKPQSIFS
jgi:hypothetical protein